LKRRKRADAGGIVDTAICTEPAVGIHRKLMDQKELISQTKSGAATASVDLILVQRER
jgi:hypothetical protein